jgi:hypothetical protein
MKHCQSLDRLAGLLKKWKSSIQKLYAQAQAQIIAVAAIVVPRNIHNPTKALLLERLCWISNHSSCSYQEPAKAGKNVGAPKTFFLPRPVWAHVDLNCRDDFFINNVLVGQVISH